MRTPGEKSRWLQGGLVLLIVLMLAFLALSPSIRAFDHPVQPDETSEVKHHP